MGCHVDCGCGPGEKPTGTYLGVVVRDISRSDQGGVGSKGAIQDQTREEFYKIAKFIFANGLQRPTAIDTIEYIDLTLDRKSNLQKTAAANCADEAWLPTAAAGTAT
jgi:hypothetical protein